MKPKHCNKSFSVEYSIYVPAGNDTAFVYGLNYTSQQKKLINDAIMAKHSNVEQVGFIDPTGKPELQMAGGEFCGNATRSAAVIYLNGKEGSLKMTVNVKDTINAGVDKNGKAWCEIPLYHGTDVITEKEPGIFIVKMNGMVTVVIQENIAKKYLKDKDNLKAMGMEFIHHFNLDYSEAVGVMFCERERGLLKINPIVWVKSIDTLFYETACGSGTTAVCMVEAFLNQKSQEIDVLQPSGMVITAKIVYSEGEISKATILGNVKTDGNRYSVEILSKEENYMVKRRIGAITPDKIEDFMNLYKVFRNPPYYEAWTDQMIRDEYYDLLKDGHVCGYYLDDVCVGLITFRPMRLKDLHPIHYEHPEKVAYLADIAVLQEYRGKGIGTCLMRYAFEVLRREGFERVYMKTLEIDKSMSYGIAIKLGFKLLEGVTSVDKMERLIKERNEEDIKIYLDKEL